MTRDAPKAQDEAGEGAHAELVVETCDHCGSPMAKKLGRFGEFLACTNYPECKRTRDLAKAHNEGVADANAGGAEEICDNCGHRMAIKRGRFGQFLACTGYPECKTTKRIQKDGKVAGPDAMIEGHCPQCSKHLVLKQGRYGPFTVCSNFPKCKYIKQEATGVTCPECGTGELGVKKSKRGAFYGCGNYPACKFSLRDKPIPESCPECGARFVVEHMKKDGSYERRCRTRDCTYKDPMPEAGF